MTQEETPKIHIDEDWKKQAQAEKERLAAQAEAREKSRGGAAGGEGQLPEASFRSLVGLLASQALMGLGTMQDPQSKGVMVDLEGAKFNIDLLAVLEEKTKGNLEDEEEKELTQIVSELRNRYVQISELIAQQGQQTGTGGQAAAGAAQQQAADEEPVAGRVGRIITPGDEGSAGQSPQGGSNG
jgi:molybdopterin converting factor small subunit